VDIETNLLPHIKDEEQQIEIRYGRNRIEYGAKNLE
jgi:hypothetical protein